MEATEKHAAELLAEAKRHRQLADSYERAAEALESPAKQARKQPRQTNGKRPRGRPLGSGKRIEEALGFLATQPSATATEIGNAMGIKSNYVYRLMASLEQRGLVREESNGSGPKRYSLLEQHEGAEQA